MVKEKKENSQVITIGEVAFPLWLVIAIITCVGLLGLIVMLMIRRGEKIVI